MFGKVASHSSGKRIDGSRTGIHRECDYGMDSAADEIGTESQYQDEKLVPYEKLFWKIYDILFLRRQVFILPFRCELSFFVFFILCLLIWLCGSLVSAGAVFNI